MPIYMAIHLSTSPTVSSHETSDLLFDVSELASIPFSMLIGYVVPSILMALPAPSVLGFDLKQSLIATWQVFPIWVGLLQQILPYIFSRFGITFKRANFPRSASQQWIGIARVVYAGLFIFAGAVHMSTLTLIASSQLFPGLYEPEHPFDPSTVFMPASISASTKMPSIGAGALQLLQYDFFVGSAAFTIWASTLFMSRKRNANFLWQWMTQALWLMLLTALVGPFGYVTACIWARDEYTFSESAGDFKKEN